MWLSGRYNVIWRFSGSARRSPGVWTEVRPREESAIVGVLNNTRILTDDCFCLFALIGLSESVIEMRSIKKEDNFWVRVIKSRNEQSRVWFCSGEKAEGAFKTGYLGGMRGVDLLELWGQKGSSSSSYFLLFHLQASPKVLFFEEGLWFFFVSLRPSISCPCLVCWLYRLNLFYRQMRPLWMMP